MIPSSSDSTPRGATGVHSLNYCGWKEGSGTSGMDLWLHLRGSWPSPWHR